MSRLAVVTAAVLAAVVAPLWTAAAAPLSSSASARASRSDVGSGQELAVRGSLWPRAERPVLVQRLLGSTWVSAASGTSSSSGGYSVDVPTTLYVGSARYRVHAPATSTYAPATSAEFTVRVSSRGSSESHSVNGSRFGYFHWDPCRTITYRVNTANAPGDAVSEVRGALLRVSAQTGLEYRYLGGTGVVPRRDHLGRLNNPADTDLVVAWPRPGQTSLLPRGPSAMGGFLAELTEDSAGRDVMAITDAFVVLDPSDYRALEPGFGSGPTSGYRGTRQQLLMHELAHTVGVGHTSATGQVMYPVMQSIPATWGNGDAAALTKVGVATQRCLPGGTGLPRRTFSQFLGVQVPEPVTEFHMER